MLDPEEFLSDHGIRSLSRFHRDHPFDARARRHDEPGRLRAGRVADRALRRQLELARAGLVPDQLPADRGAPEVPPLLRRRLHGGVPDRLGHVAVRWARSPTTCRAGSSGLFLRDADGRRPAFGTATRSSDDAAWRDRILFYEYFDGDTGAGPRGQPPDRLDGARRQAHRADEPGHDAVPEGRRMKASPAPGGPAVVAHGRAILGDLDAALRREWLVTNGIGGFAMGTLGGPATRAYHGWLVAATEPPVGRRMLVGGLVERVTVGGRTFALDAHEYARRDARRPGLGAPGVVRRSTVRSRPGASRSRTRSSNGASGWPVERTRRTSATGSRAGRGRCSSRSRPW